MARRLPLLIVPEPLTGYGFPDDRLRLIFTCCHPALDVASRVALTLNVVCGLPTADIAHLFLVPEPTMAARIARAKRKLRAAGIPYRVPGPDESPSGCRPSSSWSTCCSPRGIRRDAARR